MKHTIIDASQLELTDKVVTIKRVNGIFTIPNFFALANRPSVPNGVIEP